MKYIFIIRTYVCTHDMSRPGGSKFKLVRPIKPLCQNDRIKMWNSYDNTSYVVHWILK